MDTFLREYENDIPAESNLLNLNIYLLVLSIVYLSHETCKVT